MFPRASAGLVALLVLTAGCAASTPTTASPADPPLGDTPPPAPSASDAKVSADVARGMSALDAGDLATAKTAFDAAIRANPRDSDALYYQGALSEKSGDVAGAEASYKAALAARADSPRAQENLSALYDDAQRYDEALAITTAGLAHHSTDGMLHLNAGIAYAGKNDAASAKRELDAATALVPKDPMYRIVYGHWLAVLGQTDAATTQLRAALPLAGKDVGLVAAIGHELHMMKAYPDCVSVLTQAIALKDAAELWTERAACKIAQKDDAGAVADLKTTTAKEPTYAPAQFYLGNELAKTGDFAGAITAYQAFLKLEPNGPLAKGVTEKLKLAKAARPSAH